MEESMGKHKLKKVMSMMLAAALAFNMSGVEGVSFQKKAAVTQAADATKTIDSSATVQQIDSKDKNRPGIPDGTLLNELKRLVNTKLGRSATHDITFAELMAYDGEIDLSAIGNQITSISGLGYARKASKIVLTNVSLKAIDDYEFDGCTGLQEIVLPNGLETIGKFAFRNCNQLSQIVLPETLTSIGESAFDACTTLKELKIPNSVANISKGAFGGCTSLLEMTIPNPNIVLGASVFEGCTALQTVNLPEGITEIPPSFFASTGLTSITVPTTVKEIKQSAFNTTPLLKTVDLSKCTNLKTLGTSAFALSGIKTIQLPKSLLTIKSNAFDSSAIEEISIPDSVQGVGDGVSEGGIERLAFWNCHLLKKVSLPSGISVLQEGTFLGCWNLKEVEIRNAESSILENIGKRCFAECNQLGDTEFLKNLKNLKTIEDEAFQYVKYTDELDNAKYALFTGKLCLLGQDIYGDNEFSDGLQSVVLPDSVTTLGKNVFTGQPNLKVATLGNGLKVLPEKCFEDCVSLEKITLPAYLKNIEANAFHNCERLRGVTLPNTLETIGDSAFSDCGSVKKVENTYYHVRYVDKTKVYPSRPAGNTTAIECIIYRCDDIYEQNLGTVFLEKDAMLTEEQYQENGSPQGYEQYKIIAEKRYAKEAEVSTSSIPGMSEYTNYDFDEQTGKITGKRMLYSNATSLTSDNAVYAPQAGYTGYFVRQALYNSLYIRDYYGMDSITIPNSVTSIGQKAFYNCYNLGDIVLSNQMVKIPESAFALETVPDVNRYDWASEEQMPLQANYIKTRTVVFPEKLEIIDRQAFMNNGNLKLVNNVLPATLLSIGDSAFEECHSIESVVIPSKTKTIGNRAFYGCSEYLTLKEEIGGYQVKQMKKGVGLREIDLTQASSLESIGEYAFALTHITQCTLPAKVTTVPQGLFATCPFLSKVICSEDTNAVKADVFSNCASLVSITVPAKATISYNAFRGYEIGAFSFSITDPEPISVQIGEEESLPINTFLSDYLRDKIVITEKNGKTGFVEVANGTTETVNDWNIYKARIKGIAEGTTKLSVVGTNNYALYGDTVISKAPEVTVTVNVTRKKCTGIEDKKDSAVVSVENTTDGVLLQPQVLPVDCSEAKVWLNENENIVNVRPNTYSDNGQMVVSSSAIVVPKALGTSKVTLKVGSVKKDYQVHVVVPANSVSLSQQQISVKEDSKEQIKLVPTMTYDTAKYNAADWENYQDIISYTSSDTNVATVSDDGVVQPVSAGTAQITATALGSGKTAVCEVRVLPDETVVYFTDKDGKRLDTNQTLQVQAKDVITLNIATEPVNSLSELTYEFSNLSASGVFSYLRSTTKPIETEDKGSQDKVIAMEFSADQIGSGTITVLPKNYKNKDTVAANISVNVSADTKEAVFATLNGLEVGKESSIFGYLISSAGKAENVEDIEKITTDKVSFVSSDPTIASVNAATGVVKALKEGHVTITMQIVNPLDASKSMAKTLELDITRPVATNVIVTEKNGNNTVQVGKSLQLVTTLIPADAKDTVTFTSLTPKIASVDKNGKVTGLKQGTGMIKVVTSEKEVSAVFEFTVTKGSSVTPTPKPISVKKVTGVKAKNVKGKKMKVTWKKVAGAKGYRIVYATDSKFKKNKRTISITKNSTAKTIAKLKKGKTYYVKVQAYKKNGAKKVYGKYSAVKKAKIKK